MINWDKKTWPLLWMIVWLGGTWDLRSAEETPLQPPDTSSPRATLNSFMEIMREAQNRAAALEKEYFDSSRLYPTKEMEKKAKETFKKLSLAMECLDLSQVPDAFINRVSIESTIQLFEILDRIPLPDPASIPDQGEMEKEDYIRWRIPDTRITIALMEEGPRIGEYLFTHDTVDKLDLYYSKVQHLPSRTGRTRDLYQVQLRGAGGMRTIIPYRWFTKLPAWSKVLIFEQVVWKLIAIVIIYLLALFLIWLAGRMVGIHRKPPKGNVTKRKWARLVRPVMALLLIPLLIVVTNSFVRLTGPVVQTLTSILLGTFFLIASWSIWLSGRMLAETIIDSQRLRKRSMDSQLIRLSLRLVAIIFAIAILMEGASRLGLPAYSILAGLGVGGLAVALAARETIANLLGSMVIMVEKPFRIGHWIKMGKQEGTVEEVGFRSTRIRTFYNSLISIPNSEIINATVDNMGIREFRRVKTFLQVTYDTPPEKMEEFLEGIKNIILANPNTRKDYFHITFHDFGVHSLNILIYFFLKVHDWSEELVERQRVFIEIIRLANSMGVEFAFPTEMHIMKQSSISTQGEPESAPPGNAEPGSVNEPIN